MKITVTYIDNNSLAPEEITAQLERTHGESSIISIAPDNDDPFSIIYFAIQELITARQINSFHDDGDLYEKRLEVLKEEARRMADEAILQVIKDNEIKLV